MRIIAKSTIVAFWEKHPDSAQQLKSWYHEAHCAKWKNPGQIKAQYRNASILKYGRVVFNICGDKYRLLCVILFGQGIIFIKFVGTHKQYDGIEAETYDNERA